jgi:hypothetical protein
MKNDYDYQKYTEVLKDLQEKKFNKISEFAVKDLITSSIEFWAGAGHNVIVERHKDGYAAIYIDIDTLKYIN